MSASNGVISGAPTTAGTYPISTTISYGGVNVPVSFELPVVENQTPVYNGSKSLNGTLWTPFSSYDLASHFSTPATVTVVSDDLTGSGLSVSNGVISAANSPKKAGTYAIEFTGTYNNQTSTKYTIKIDIASVTGTVTCPTTLSAASKSTVTVDATFPASVSDHPRKSYNFTAANSSKNYDFDFDKLNRSGSTMTCKYKGNVLLKDPNLKATSVNNIVSCNDNSCTVSFT